MSENVQSHQEQMFKRQMELSTLQAQLDKVCVLYGSFSLCHSTVRVQLRVTV